MKAALLTLALLFVGLVPARAQIAIPALESRVTDLTGTLTAAQQSALEDKLAAFERRKGVQIAVLILPSTAPEDIAQFGIRLLESWKLGRKGIDDGAALIVAKDDRALRIEVQYGLEGVLTDATSSRIINETIVPHFKEGDFAGGITAGVDQILRVVDGEPLPAPDPSWKRDNRGGVPGGIAPLLIMLVVFIGGFVRRTVGRGIAGGITGLITAGAVFAFTSSWIFACIAGGIVAVVVLAMGAGALRLLDGMGGRSGGYWPSGGSSGGWSGRSSGGFGGGSSGGIFTGGGGRGGGGGASGRW